MLEAISKHNLTSGYLGYRRLRIAARVFVSVILIYSLSYFFSPQNNIWLKFKVFSYLPTNPLEKFIPHSRFTEKSCTDIYIVIRQCSFGVSNIMQIQEESSEKQQQKWKAPIMRKENITYSSLDQYD